MSTTLSQVLNHIQNRKSIVFALLSLLLATSSLQVASANNNVIDPGDQLTIYRAGNVFVANMNYGTTDIPSSGNPCGSQSITSEGGNGRNFFVYYNDNVNNNSCGDSLEGTAGNPSSWNVRGLSAHLLAFEEPTIRPLEVGEGPATHKVENGIAIASFDNDQFAIDVDSNVILPNGAVVGYEITLPEPPTGCYIDAPTDIDEGVAFTVTVQCGGVDGMFGFEFGTSQTGDGTTSAASYTVGDFENNAANTVLTASNTMALFSQAHTGSEVSDGTYSLGSYDATADKYLTADGQINITLDNFLASNISGAALAALAASPDATITVNNIILTLLQGNVTVASDGMMTNINNVALALDGGNYSAATDAGSSIDLAVDQEGNLLDISISADMDSHLACSGTVTIPDGNSDPAASIGTITLLAGDVVSVSGDNAINLHDAVAIGTVFGGTATGEEDVNDDGAVNIFDLVHVGRNYNATGAACIPPTTYAIGDVHPDGGIVFAVDATGEHGWIVQSADHGRFTFADMVAEATAVGNGWTSPGIDQLEVIYAELHLNGIGNFSAEHYRSGTSSGYPSYPWALRFTDGAREGNGLAAETLVRFVKEF